MQRCTIYAKTLTGNLRKIGTMPKQDFYNYSTIADKAREIYTREMPGYDVNPVLFPTMEGDGHIIRVARSKHEGDNRNCTLEFHIY